MQNNHANQPTNQQQHYCRPYFRSRDDMTHAPTPADFLISPAPTHAANDPFCLPPTIEPGYCICEVRACVPDEDAKDIFVSWLGYHELAGIGYTHNDLEVMQIVEYTIDGAYTRDGKPHRRAHVEPVAPATLYDEPAAGWCYSGSLIVPKDWNRFPYKCALQLHATAEPLDDYTNEVIYYKSKTRQPTHG